jgi:hypothetical protein
MGDWFYALRVARTKRASKGYLWESDRLVRDYDYDAGYKFDAVRSTEFGDIKGLAAALGKLESRDNYFVIRGELRGGDFRKESVNRRYLWNDPDHQPDWDARDRQWAMFDIDNIEWTGPEMVTREEYERTLVGIIRDILPQCFRDVSFYYHMSSSAGLTKIDDGSYRVGHTTLKVHLWYWLDRPVCDGSLRDWIRSNKMSIDAAPFNPVQPHYTSNPTFRGGDDPLTWRSGIVDQIKPVLVLPAEVVTESEWLKKKREPRPSTMTYAKQSALSNSVIKRACERIMMTAAGEGRHYMLNKSAFELGGRVAAGAMIYGDCYAALCNAGLSVGITHSEVERITKDAMSKGMQHPLEFDNVDVWDPPVMLGTIDVHMFSVEKMPVELVEEIRIEEKTWQQRYFDDVMRTYDDAMTKFALSGCRQTPKELHWFAVCEHVDKGYSDLLDNLPIYAAYRFGERAAQYYYTKPRDYGDRVIVELIISGEITR